MSFFHLFSQWSFEWSNGHLVFSDIIFIYKSFFNKITISFRFFLFFVYMITFATTTCFTNKKKKSEKRRKMQRYHYNDIIHIKKDGKKVRFIAIIIF